jgi:hypothetical protein
MIRWNKSMRVFFGVVALGAALHNVAIAQTYGGGGATTGGTTGGTTAGATTAAGATGLTAGAATNQHLRFDRPESWALKYFASATMLSGLQPPEASPESRRIGSITLGLEMEWLPELSEQQRRVGFNGRALEDLNKAPLFARPSVRVGLPWKLSLVAAAPPPFRAFGVTSHLLAFGVERPILDRRRWVLGWRGYGQFGTVKGAFTCPRDVLAFPPASSGNPGRCIGESSDVASLRYAGTELQFAYRIRSLPKFIPHVASGINFIDAAFQVDAPLTGGRDRTRLWTRGKTFSESAGVSYLFSRNVALTVDAFYTPLWVRRTPDAPRTNDGLFNVRALVSYTLR